MPGQESEETHGETSGAQKNVEERHEDRGRGKKVWLLRSLLSSITQRSTISVFGGGDSQRSPDR